MNLFKMVSLFFSFMKGGEQTMVDLYVVLIINGRRTIDKVPAKLRQAVIDTLAAAGLDENGDPLE